MYFYSIWKWIKVQQISNTHSSPQVIIILKWEKLLWKSFRQQHKRTCWVKGNKENLCKKLFVNGMRKRILLRWKFMFYINGSRWSWFSALSCSRVILNYWSLMDAQINRFLRNFHQKHWKLNVWTCNNVNGHVSHYIIELLSLLISFLISSIYL